MLSVLLAENAEHVMHGHVLKRVGDWNRCAAAQAQRRSGQIGPV
jgi:hypothetical protein